jgi:hypothetical protein
LYVCFFFEWALLKALPPKLSTLRRGNIGMFGTLLVFSLFFGVALSRETQNVENCGMVKVRETSGGFIEIWAEDGAVSGVSTWRVAIHGGRSGKWLALIP